MLFCSAGRVFPGTRKAAFENKQEKDCWALTDGSLEMGFKARVWFPYPAFNLSLLSTYSDPEK